MESRLGQDCCPGNGDTADTQFTGLMAQLRAGSTRAALLVYQRLTPPLLIRLCRYLQKFPQPLRQRLDAEDSLLEAWRVTLAKIEAGKDFRDERRLSNFILRVAQRCGQHQYRNMRTQRRSWQQEQPLAAAEWARFMAGGADPARAAASADSVQHYLTGLSPDHRDVARLRLDGYAPEEIADSLRLSRRTVFRRLVELRDLGSIDQPGLNYSRCGSAAGRGGRNGG